MSNPGRLASILRPLGLIQLAIRLHWDAFKAMCRKDGLAAVLHLKQVRDVAVAKLFSITCTFPSLNATTFLSLIPSPLADGFIAYENTTTLSSLVGAAQGKVLELGPGPGNQIHRYDASRVDCIYGIDPNPHFEADIAAKLKKHTALEQKYKFLACGVEDSDILRKEGITEGSLDAVTSIQVLCAVDDVKSVMREVYKLLKPGGKFIFWEHGKSKDTITATTQVLLNPAWHGFVGCSMTRDVKADILAAGEWENPREIIEADDIYTCLPRLEGVLIKKA